LKTNSYIAARKVSSACRYTEHLILALICMCRGDARLWCCIPLEFYCLV